MTAPDLPGRDSLALAASTLRPYTPPPPRRRRRLRPKWIAAILAADVVVGGLLWHVVGRHQDSPVQAVRTVATLAGRGDWNGVYDHLCSADRQQFSESELASGATEALQVLHGLAGVRISEAHSVRVHLIGPFSLPAEQVSGQLLPPLGAPLQFHATVVRELNGWRLCLAVGGYGAPALGIDVPLGAG